MEESRQVRAGAALGRYELLAPVARGGMAEVWAARLKGTRGFQKLVALKTILPALSDDPRFERMFLDEAALASRIRHPHVVQILDLGEERDVLYLVMEWIDGETLATLLRKCRGPVPVEIASRLVMQACAGLHAAHELRDDDGRLLDLVHRDVSPQNLLVTRQGTLKIVDFGIAKALGRLGGETAVGNIKGKIPYMAPEQALAAPLDRRADVFALGTVYYFLATGQHPFRGADEGDTIRNVIAAAPQRPRAIEPSVPPEIEAVIMTALARDPVGRYPTMAAFETAIGQALTALGTVVNDQAVKEYMVAALGDRAEERHEWLLDAIRRADLQAAPHSSNTPTTTEPTAVTAGSQDDSSVSVGSDVARRAALSRRSAARVALLAGGLALGGVVAGVWLGRNGGQVAPAVPSASAPAAAIPEGTPPTAAESATTAALSAPAAAEPIPTAAPSASASVAAPPRPAGPRPPPVRGKPGATAVAPSPAPTVAPSPPPATTPPPAPKPPLPGYPL